MNLHLPVNQLLHQINTISRRQCIDELLVFDAIPLDFEKAFLRNLSTAQLRHLLMAAVLTVKHRHCRKTA